MTKYKYKFRYSSTINIYNNYKFKLWVLYKIKYHLQVQTIDEINAVIITTWLLFYNYRTLRINNVVHICKIIIAFNYNYLKPVHCLLRCDSGLLTVSIKHERFSFIAFLVFYKYECYTKHVKYCIK